MLQLWLPNFLTIQFYKGIIVISWSFSYNSFVKLSLYNIIHLYHGPFLWIPNIADCTCHQLTNALLKSEVGRGYSLNISAHRSEITNLTCYQLTTVYVNQLNRKCSDFVKRWQPAKIATYFAFCAGYFDRLVHKSIQ